MKKTGNILSSNNAPVHPPRLVTGFDVQLTDVHGGGAEDVYAKPDIFFEHTYRAEGLRTLLQEVLGRLTGVIPGNSPVIRLETSFGGGKTHNLIALYHLAKGKVVPKAVSDLVAPELVPRTAMRPVPLVGSDLDPSSGMHHGEVTTYTLWGEMAYQLGGVEAYKLVESNDRDRSRPGEATLKKLFG